MDACYDVLDEGRLAYLAVDCADAELRVTRIESAGHTCDAGEKTLSFEGAQRTLCLVEA